VDLEIVFGIGGADQVRLSTPEPLPKENAWT
jgi:hypothetical protein